MKTLSVTSVLLMGLGFSAMALSPSRTMPLANTEAAWDAIHKLHACSHLRTHQVGQCVARAQALQTAARDAPAGPERANQREEARLEHADEKYTAATRRCMHSAADHQPGCLAAAKAAMVDAWNQTSRDGAAADAELKKRPR